jgi:hypothetical protein
MSTSSHRRRIVAGAILFGTLSGCSNRVSHPVLSVHTTPVAKSTTLIIHLTGLLLLVPPKEEGGETHVLMPPPHSGKAHEAFLEFIGTHADLCEPGNDSVCLVDMKKWAMEPVGAGGGLASTTMDGLPRAILNVTSGSRDSVDISNVPDTLIAARLLTGRITVPTCNRATWYFNPPGLLNATARGAANLADWEIHLPGRSVTLHFKQRHPPHDRDSVTLTATSDTMQILLSHNPKRGRPTLPPLLSTPEDFSAFYDLLSDTTKNGGARIPRLLWPLRSEPCVDDVETRRHGRADPGRGQDTYSCLLATAERK